MITLYNLADAAPVAFFGMFALWAAASKRHWFLRTAVVAGTILFTLLIPAYEVLVTLTVETLLVVAGLAIWRRRRHAAVGMHTDDISSRFRLRLSMETLMLAIVIVAVVTAVAARVPNMPGESWYSYTIDGFMSGTIGLACVWIICGRARWWIRAIGAPILVFLLAFSLVTLRWAGHIVKHWFLVMSGSYGGSSTTEYWQLARRDIWPSTLSWTSTVALGMAILCAWLYCLRRAGWFDPFHDMSSDPTETPRRRRATTVARACAVILFFVVAIFPLALFYALLTPTPIPNEPLPEPNGFDDLIAAGNMIGPTAARTYQSWDQLTIEQVGAELAKDKHAFERMNLGLQRQSRNPYVFKPVPRENSLSLTHLWIGWYGKSAFDRQKKNLEQELSNHLTMLRLAQEEGRGSGVHYFGGIFNQYEKDGYTGIWSCAPQLSATKCVKLIAELCGIEARREPWNERVATQRAIDDHSGWQKHLCRILADWSGEDQYKWQRIEEWRRVAQLRKLVVKLAIRAYQWENSDQLPESLHELVPKYLPAVPIDPFGGKDLLYRKDGRSYVLYSCGPDEDDDGGQPRAVENGEEIGDMTDAALFNPPIFQPSIGPP